MCCPAVRLAASQGKLLDTKRQLLGSALEHSFLEVEGFREECGVASSLDKEGKGGLKRGSRC